MRIKSGPVVRPRHVVGLTDCTLELAFETDREVLTAEAQVRVERRALLARLLPTVTCPVSREA